MKIRKAIKEDVPEILNLIKGLAEYENLSHKVISTEELLEKNGFGDNRYFETLLLEEESGQAIGYAMYLFTFSSFIGRPTLYIENIYLKPEYRKKGLGKKLFQELAKIAKQKDCARMDWAVLDSNEPSIKFYESIGARSVSEWMIFRLEENQIDDFAKEKV